MASEGLSAHPLSDIPKLSRGVASTRDKQACIRSQRQRHHIPGVTCKCGCLLPCLNIPKSTANVTNTNIEITKDQRKRGTANKAKWINEKLFWQSLMIWVNYSRVISILHETMLNKHLEIKNTFSLGKENCCEILKLSDITIRIIIQQSAQSEHHVSM